MGIQASYLTKTKQILSDRYTALSTALTKHLPEGAHAPSLTARCLLEPAAVDSAMDTDIMTVLLLSGTTFEVPDGGYFVLVRLPEGAPMLAKTFCPRAASAYVASLETDFRVVAISTLLSFISGTDCVAFNNFCQETGKKVMFLPGAGFGAAYGNFLRLSFSYYDAAEMAIGAERLGKAITAFLSQ